MATVGGASKIKTVCNQLLTLGYHTAVLCDNDAPTQITVQDIKELHDAGAHICQWDSNNSTEKQLFTDIPWQDIPKLLETICSFHDTLEFATVIDLIIKEPRVRGLRLGNDPASWTESPTLRQVMGDLAKQSKWIKRIDYAEGVFEFALSRLTETSVIKTRLDALFTWLQKNER